MDKVTEVLQTVINELPKNIVFLCGAGISVDYPTKLPTVKEFIFSALEECHADEESVQKVSENFYKRNIRFEWLIDEIKTYLDKDLVVGKLFSSNSYNKIHYFLAQMLRRGASIITTNFDTCIENAALSFNEDTLCFNRIVYTGTDIKQEKSTSGGMLLKVHGSNPLSNEVDTDLVITISSMAKTNNGFFLLPNLRNLLLETIKNKIIVVMGYSCSDDFDVLPLLLASKPNKIIWLNYNYKIEYPESDLNFANDNIKLLNENLPLEYFSGQLLPLINSWAESLSFKVGEGTLVHRVGIKDYIEKHCSKSAEKTILTSLILLAYSVYEEITYDKENALSIIPAIIACFRLGDFGKAVELSEQVLRMEVDEVQFRGVFYFYSSTLYYLGEYQKSKEIGHKSIELAIKSKDNKYYLSAIINYAAILNGIADVDVTVSESYIKKAIILYNYVLTKSRGISLDSEADAYWGLGWIAGKQHNKNLARKYLNKALNIYIGIGDQENIRRILDSLNYFKK